MYTKFWYFQSIKSINFLKLFGAVTKIFVFGYDSCNVLSDYKIMEIYFSGSFTFIYGVLLMATF